jgi:hypothetical protein
MVSIPDDMVSLPENMVSVRDHTVLLYNPRGFLT